MRVTYQYEGKDADNETVASLAVNPNFHTIEEGVKLTECEIVETAGFQPSRMSCFHVDEFADEK